MSAGPLFLGVDVGTQGTKALVYEQKTGKVLSRGAKAYDILKSNVPGRAEQHPSLWIDGSVEAISSALSKVDRKRVKGIGISGQQHGFVPVDKKGEVIRNAKLWCDVESAKEAATLSEKWSYNLVPGFTASKILWLKENEPENFEKLAKVLLPHDYMNWYLTGRYVAEAGDASGTGLFDTPARTYDQSRMQTIDSQLGSFFPELIGPNDVVGTLKKDVAEQLGLAEDVIVAPGSGDNQMSALGAGAVTEGSWVVSLGTSGTLFGASNSPIVDPSGGIAPFCDATGKWMPLLCTMNCTLVTEEARKAFGMDHGEITALASKENPGADGTNFLPFLTGERTPNWPDSYGVLTGLRPGALSPGRLYRAALEGATYPLLYGMKLLQQFGVTANELRIVGGGSKNPLWRQIIADSFQLPLRFPTEPESAALGGALQAAAVYNGASVADYIVENEPPLSEEEVYPNDKLKDAYEEAFRRHDEISKGLFDKGLAYVK